MKELIKGSIDVLKINKDKLYTGKKGKYLNIVLIPTPNSEYGDWMIVEETTEEERKAGEKGTILGNAKVLVKKDEDKKTEPQEDTGLPF
jgi:hypothetical protein